MNSTIFIDYTLSEFVNNYVATICIVEQMPALIPLEEVDGSSWKAPRCTWPSITGYVCDPTSVFM